MDEGRAADGSVDEGRANDDGTADDGAADDRTADDRAAGMDENTMIDNDFAGHDIAPTPTRRGPDPVTLVAGLLAIGIAAWSIVDAGRVLPPQWMLAGAAVLVGILMLIASIRPRR